MIHTAKRYWPILALTSLLLAQVAAIAVRKDRGSSGAAAWLSADGDVSMALVGKEDGQFASLATGEALVLMVFASDCAHCLRTAPLWRSWLENQGQSMRAVALSAESYQSAAEYAALHKWDVDVWTTRAGAPGGLESRLTSRTPWVFVLNGSGVVLAEGHGARIDEIVTSTIGTQSSEGASP